MKESFKKFWEGNPRVKRVIGVFLILLGVISIITPFTPFGWLAIIGMELLGIRIAFWDRAKDWWRKTSDDKNV
jgi:hypothetical protein